MTGPPGRAARRRARRAAPPLPQRAGLDPIRWRLPQDAPARPAAEALAARFPPLLDPRATPLGDRFARGEVVDAAGTVVRADDLVAGGDELWFHRELRAEVVPAVDLVILHRDRSLLILDKPHDMATMPRGEHILSSALVRLRRGTGIETLVPLHRLDRRTAGVLAFGIRPEERAAYQQLFARGRVEKEYLARVADAGGAPLELGGRFTMRDRLAKHRGELTVRVLKGEEPDAVTDVEVLSRDASGAVLLRLRPRTGRTHQLRAQLSHRGHPILGEDLYPRPRTGEHGHLQLLARRLALTDPITGDPLQVISEQRLATTAPD